MTRRWFDRPLDVLAVVGIVAVLVFPVAALLSVEPTAEAEDAAVTLPPLRSTPAGEPVRDLPVFADGDAAARAVADGRLLTDQAVLSATIDEQARLAFGPNAEDALAALVAASRDDAVNARAAPPTERHPAVDAALDARLGVDPLPGATTDAVNDLAGLLVLDAALFPGASTEAASVAYSLYDRARAGGACAPQLNLAFLLSTDTSTPSNRATTQYDDTVRELRAAARACSPRDPTARWLLGQYQSGQRDDEAAFSTFRALERRLPGSVAGWSGEADARLRHASRIDVASPFTARADFSRAQALYARAGQLDPDALGLAAGAARASAGLAHFDAAVRQQRRALEQAADLDRSRLRERLVTYLEASGDFGGAADAETRRLTASDTGPRTAGLFPAGTDFSGSGVRDVSIAEDTLGPISLGLGRLLPVRLDVLHNPRLAFTDAVTDISFIPHFRTPSDVVESTGWCRVHRDRFLAGDVSSTPVTDQPCRTSTGLLEGILFLERGDSSAATAGVRGFATTRFAHDHDPATAAILDAEQNLWRFAGDFDKAADVAARLRGLEPDDPSGPDRAGEIAYLRGRYRVAADRFAEAAARAQGTSEGIRAHELLKEGTARSMAGERASARRVLAEADAAASALVPAGSTPSGVSNDVLQAMLDSYNARVQTGDNELRARRFRAAATAYAAAREREPQLPPPDAAPAAGGSRRDHLFRPEVLENNQALVLVELGDHEAALEAIDAAVKRDPANPVFRGNQGFVLEELDRPEAAKSAYRAALAADATAAQAANNLGVLLADEGHLSRAADAFRRARAANPDYAIAAFNLGLVLDRMGPSHVLESQGELATATRLEHELREHDHTLITDDETYFTTLDLSKPLPPNWHLASSQQRQAITVAGVVLALLAFQLFRTFLQDKAIENAASRTVDESTGSRSARVARFGARIPGVVALAAVVAVVLYPLARSSHSTTGDFLLLGAGAAIVVLAFMRLRSAVARHYAIEAQHYPCLPAVAFGGAAAVVGLGFAPMPATKSGDPLPHHARWLTTALLGSLTVALVVTGRFTGVPFATELGMVCLVMTASALIPVAPYDGRFFERRHVGLLLAIGLTTLAVLVELGIL